MMCEACMHGYPSYFLLITLIRFITMLCGTGIIPQTIPPHSLNTTVIKINQLFKIYDSSENVAIFYFTSYCQFIPHTDFPMPSTEL